MTVAKLLGLTEPKPYKPEGAVYVACAAPHQMVGVELEIEAIPFRREFYQANLTALWDVDTDGSLRGNAFEFISKPVEIGILIPELQRFFDFNEFNERNYSDRCSVHVHTNVCDMTPHQIAGLCLVYSVVEDVLFEFINHYKVDDPRGKYRDTNLYCVPWSQCRMNPQLVKTMFEDLNFAFRNWQKYTALNLVPAREKGTVEWRHMHGTADMEKLTLWLNLIGSIMNYSKKMKIEDIVKIIRDLNDTSAYKQFFTEVLGGYLPFDVKHNQALAAGVVNAKYSLIGLNNFNVKAIKKEAIKKVAVAGDHPVFRMPPMPPARVNNPPPGPLDNGDWVAQIDDAIAAELPMAPMDVNGEQIRPQHGAVDRFNERENRFRELELRLQYPLQRGALHGAGHGGAIGILTQDGFIYDGNGLQMPDQVVFLAERSARGAVYCKGFGMRSWLLCDADWRPENYPVAEREQREEL